MSVTSLLSRGNSDGGKLEKFADGCNAMARSLWLGGHKVVFLKNGSNYTLKVSKKGETGTSMCMAAAGSCMNARFHPIFVLVSLIIVLGGYALACIPVALAMGVLPPFFWTQICLN